MRSPQQGSNDERLDLLLRAYRDAFPELDASPNFMPILWQRIEARRKFNVFFRRIAGGLVTAAVALTLVMAVYVSPGVDRSHRGAFYSETYVEALADSHAAENPALYETVRADSSDDSGIIDLL
jgi:hypothetical protein